MATLYADRAFISVNGVEMVDVESATLKQSDGTKAVPTMSRNRRNKGFVKGNREISISLSTAVQNKLGSAKLESIDFEKNDVALTFQVGDSSDRYTATGLNLVDTDEGASGVGSEVKKSFNLVALDVIDQVGNSSLFNLTF
jgi:hypothetical protein